MEFQDFPKMARWSRDIIITEKIDGTNAQVCIGEAGEFFVGSRTRWITPEDDNHGFARWAFENKDELMKLGPGRHFGEWWGSGVQRGYGLTKGDKRFSLFNTSRWSDASVRPACCHVVPVLYQGPMVNGVVDQYIEMLRATGSMAADGFMDPEGIVLFHTAANFGFKKTLKKDEVPKSLAR
jgi:RNA ligase-like protein